VLASFIRVTPFASLTQQVALEILLSSTGNAPVMWIGQTVLHKLPTRKENEMEYIQTESGRSRPEKSGLEVGFARSQSEILEAQRLRYSIFADEMGANLPSRTSGVDHDMYDPYCEHLVVRDTQSGDIVGTYRILSPENAWKVGYYAENEFDLTRLQHLNPRLVEIGRSCVHQDYRTGATIALLWSGLAQYMLENGYDYLMGCASISMADGGHNAASLYRRLEAKYLGPQEYRVFPLHPLPLAALQQDRPAETPPLIKGYLRAGAWICGEPAWDPDFNTADLHILMPMAKLAGRYARHYMGKAD
jgi:putative hemolysin